MTTTFETPISEPDALAILAILRSESDLELVSYGAYALDLQLPDAPSPHAVNLDASFAAGRLRLVFHMAEGEARKRVTWLVELARARGIRLSLDELKNRNRGNHL